MGEVVCYTHAHGLGCTDAGATVALSCISMYTQLSGHKESTCTESALGTYLPQYMFVLVCSFRMYVG